MPGICANTGRIIIKVITYIWRIWNSDTIVLNMGESVVTIQTI